MNKSSCGVVKLCETLFFSEGVCVGVQVGDGSE